MRLEPISERPPQHARCGARRATLHNVVLAVEKICGIARIERHRRKPRKRRELRPRPLPPVPDKIVHAESARARGMRSHRRGIPRFEIEVSPGRARRFLAPRIGPFFPALGGSIRGAMKLRFGRQFASQPLRICGGLGVAHVYRPLLRQTNLAKHRMINPQVALAPPEHRMLDAFLRLPGPGFFTPQGAVLVTPRLHKPKKFVIRYVVVVDGELFHLDFMRPKFVVPAEFFSLEWLQSQRSPPGGDLHQMRLHPQRLPRRSLGSRCSRYASVSACINRCSMATSSIGISCGCPSAGRSRACSIAWSNSSRIRRL